MVYCSLFHIMKWKRGSAISQWKRVKYCRYCTSTGRKRYRTVKLKWSACSGHLPPTNYWKSNKNVCYKNVYRACERRVSFHSQNIHKVYFKMRLSLSISALMRELWTVKLCKTEYYHSAEVCHWQQTGEETKIPVLKIL